MRWIAKYRKQRMGALAAAMAVTAWMPTAMMADAGIDHYEVPTGAEAYGTAEVGQAAIKDGKNEMTINVKGARGTIDWTTFNIGKDARVKFTGGNDFKVLNRVKEGNLSKIYGELNAPGGTVFLVNPSGITFGAGAQVNVGSLVASTLNISDKERENFIKVDTNGAYVNKAFTFEGKGGSDGGTIKVMSAANNVPAADIKANGVVALLAHKIDNYGNITAKQVAMASGTKITLNKLVENGKTEVAYDDKIGVVINTATNDGYVCNREGGVIEAKDGYVLMTAKYAQNLLNTTIKNAGTIKATRLAKDESGNIILDGGRTLVYGELSTDGGTVTTKGYDMLQVNDDTVVNAKNWNVLAKSVTVKSGVTEKDSSKGKNEISNNAINKALEKGNVDIVAAPQDKSYYADIYINEVIKKEKGDDETNLNITAGRNISVDADITSYDNAGALNVSLNANNKEKTNSAREDGATVIKANIRTNGGDFTTTGSVGTYFGLKNYGVEGGEPIKTVRSVTTKGGNISLGGDQVLLATGGEVFFDAGNGKVYIEGTVDSANVYRNVNSTQSAVDSNKNYISWYEANAHFPEKADKEGDSHLAVITSRLEDSVVSSSIPKNSGASTEAYVGGHVVAVPVDDKKAPLDCKLENGKIVLSGDLADGKLDNVRILKAADETNVKINGKSRGWYKLSDGKTYVRFWAWTSGPEKGKIFYVQAAEVSADNKYVKHLDTKFGYSNFAPNEPNDDSFKGAEPALAVNYDTYKNEDRNKVLYSQWDDIFENPVTGNSQNLMQNYVVETELGHTSLKINASDTVIHGEVGGVTKLNHLDIDSSGNITLQGAQKIEEEVDGKIVERWHDYVGAVNVDNDVNASASGDITTTAINAGNTINLAGSDVTLKKALTAGAKNTENAVEIRAQNRFINEVETDSEAVTVGENSHWKIYSAMPYEELDGKLGDKLGGLNSEAFAVWGWDGKATVSDKDNNLYIFKYHPTITYTADNATKKYGETISDTGYTYENEMDGQFLNNFQDGYNVLFMGRTGMKSAGTASAGYPAWARVGTYSINMTNADTATAWGYNVVKNPGVLTVTGYNPGNVKPQLDPHNPTNLDGSASYTTAPRQAGPGADRVLGLQSAELPFFREENGQTKLYGTYDVSVDPEKVKMEPTAKVLPEPDQPKTQYREYDKELTTQAGTAKFKMTYNGSTFDIYPVDNSAKDLLVAGDAAKNVDVESQALFAAFKEMGITLDDLDGVYTHFDSKKEAQS